jgi:hypothetical protein
MSEHDPFCRWPGIQVRSTGPLGDIVFDGCDCDLIRRVRADEREFLAPEVPMARDDLRNELRAKVEALAGGGYVRGHTTVWLHDVLALLDRSGDE